MYVKSCSKKLVCAAVATSAIASAFQCMVITEANSQAAVFEVIHPDVEQGEIEIEVLNGVSLNGIDDGEERSVHEFAIGYGFTDYWKFTTAVEVANRAGDSTVVEAFEFENLLILHKGSHHDEKFEKGGDEHHSDFTLGFYTALEVPKEGGISEGGIEFGPVFEKEFGPVEFIGNLFVEVPFADGEDAGLAYATQTVLPVSDSFGIGVETFGAFEGLFGDRGDDIHLAGPGLYWESELPSGHVIEPRVAVLFGLNDESPDAILSFNLEYKIGQR